MGAQYTLGDCTLDDFSRDGQRGLRGRMETFLAILTGIIIAAASSWITVQLSLNRFRAEKWWELRVGAYERVIEALHDSKSFSNEHLDADIEGRKLSDEARNELGVRAMKAEREIARAADLGGFLLGNQARERLKQYQVDKGDASGVTDWMTYLEGSWDAADSCLQDIIKIARQDLTIDKRSKST